MKEDIEIPGGRATFWEPSDEDMPGRGVKVLKAAAAAAVSQLAEFPEIFEPPREGETAEQRTERLSERLNGMALNIDQAMALDNLREATVVATLKSWTLDRRLPTLDTVGDLPHELYEALLELVGGMSAAQLEENFNPTGDALNPLGDPNDRTPTGDSGSSDGPSKADLESTQTTESSSDGILTDGEASSPEQ